jgi:flavin-binding protein dodecin
MEEGSVYKIIDLVGTSPKSWEDAVANAVAMASKNLRDLRIAEVKKLDAKIEDGKIVAYRARVKLSFKYEKE